MGRSSQLLAVFLVFFVCKTEGKGFLRHSSSNKCITPVDTWPVNGGKIKVVECNLDDYLQQWNVEYFKAMEIIPGLIQHEMTGRALSASGTSGSIVYLSDPTTSNNQKWTLLGNPYWNFIYQIQNVETELCLEWGNSKLTQEPCVDQSQYPFSLQYWLYSYYPFSSNGGLIRSVPYGTSIVLGSNMAGTPLKLGPVDPVQESPSTGAIWNVHDFLYKLRIGDSGILFSAWDDSIVMSVIGQGTQNEAHVILDTKVPGARYQLWSVEPVYIGKGGVFREVYIKSNASGRCLTAERKGEYLDIYDCVGAAHQRWHFVPAETWQGQFSDNCFSGDECLSGACENGACQVGHQKNPCRTPNDCASGQCISGYCACRTGGAECAKNEDCCNDYCSPTHTCGCVETDVPCFTSYSCCSGICSKDGFCKCKPAGQGCNAKGFPGQPVGVDCCSGKCGTDGICARNQPGQPCQSPKDCESKMCSSTPGFANVCVTGASIHRSCDSDESCKNSLGSGAVCNQNKGCCFASSTKVSCIHNQANENDMGRAGRVTDKQECCSGQCYPLGPPWYKRKNLKNFYTPQCT